MRVKDIMQIFSRLTEATRTDTVKKYLSVLTIIIVVGTLGLISLPQRSQQKSWISASNASTFQSHFINNLIKQEYLLPDEDNTNIDDFSEESFKKFHKWFTITNFELVANTFINPHLEIFFDAGKFSPYISFFASIPLRSPPLFS